MCKEDKVADARSREMTYRFLSGMFLTEVTADFLASLCERSPMLEGELADYAASLDLEKIEDARVEAAADFAAVLLNMSVDPAKPYESVHTSELGLMMQDARDEVVAAYRSEGFVARENLRIPEDHVGIELAFMAELAAKERAALEADDTAAAVSLRAKQALFLERHLLNWVPGLCDDVARRAKTGLYRGLAETTKQFLAYESEDFAA